MENENEQIDSAALVVAPHQEISMTSAPPMEVVARAREQAKALITVVRDGGWFADIKGKEYLKVEGWELIGRFNGVSAIPEYVEAIGDPIEGYKAKVNLYNQEGNIVGSGIMLCGMDDWVCKGKSGLAKDNACMSMAQTRATSKAYRLNFSWVAVLAGFQPTPAEEMQSDSSSPNSQNDPYLCTKHGKKWFKSANMPAYAHPGGDNGRWCNMDDAKADEEVAAEQYQRDEDKRFQEAIAKEEPAPIPLQDDASMQSNDESYFADRGPETAGELPW